MIESRSLSSGFLASVKRFPGRVALRAEGRELTYSELFDLSAAIATTLRRESPDPDPGLTAVFGYRSVVAFAGVLGALLRGHGYVPLNRTFPVDRSRTMLQRSLCRAIVVDLESSAQLDDLLDGCAAGLCIILAEHDDVSGFSARMPQHRFLGRSDLAEPADPVAADPDDIAYLLFTSGSTGVPKGVMVAHRNVIPFVDAMVERYGITEEDRFSQTFDMTFDLSVFDMFVAWERGASVHCPGQRELIQPGRFVRESSLTVWFSVPSTGIFMRRLGALKPGSYPTLRWSLFCGEPLPVPVAQAWSDAAPDSIVENLYGPTEVTIACTLYRWNPGTSLDECERGLVPIGEPYPGMRALVADEHLRPVAPGEIGELLMGGAQVTPGYWKDPQKTAEVFVIPPDQTDLHYRTGDLVRRPREGQPLVYIRRMDHQIKIQGHRVELGEIEAVLRRESGIDAVVALGWPVTDQGAGGVVAFIGDPALDVQEIQRRCGEHLPGYMVPRKIHLETQLPLNSNGKFDRKALFTILEERDS
jgi:amino acid adenylation domain-containing protein